MMKKDLRFFVIALCAYQCSAVGLVFAQKGDADRKKTARHHSAAVVEIKQMIGDLTVETNKVTAAVNASQQGKDVVNALEVWAKYFDSWKKKAKALESKKGFKFLKATGASEELNADLNAFMVSVQNMSQSLQAKMDLFKDNPQYQKRIESVMKKLNDK